MTAALLAEETAAEARTEAGQLGGCMTDGEHQQAVYTPFLPRGGERREP